MPAMKNAVYLIWGDKNGQFATTFWTTQDQDAGAASSYSGLGDAAQAISDCGLKAVVFQQVLHVDNDPADGPYCTAFDRADFNFTFAGRKGTVLLGVPGPKAEIFESDNITVNLTNTDVMAFIAAMEDFIGDGAGNDIAAPRGGRRAEH